MSTEFCTSVSAACPVSATTYGYRPNLGGNIFFCAAFGLLSITQIGLGIRYRTWTWLIATVIGITMECLGYGGRLIMNENPWSQSGFELQIVMLILAPSFLSASVDLTLKHIVIVFGKQYSHIKPALYTWFFISLDIFSILMQAIGGGVSSAANHGQSFSPSLLQTGNNLMLAGIAIQVAQLVLFGIVTVDYLRRLYRGRRTNVLSERAQDYLKDWKFRGFAVCVVIAYFAILIRCIYRLPEMAHGWGNGLQRQEDTFLVLDGMMILIAAIALTIFHPGFAFPQLAMVSLYKFCCTLNLKTDLSSFHRALTNLTVFKKSVQHHQKRQ
jgi:hypothetical protein